MLNLRFAVLCLLTLMIVCFSGYPSISAPTTSIPTIKVNYAYYTISGKTARELRAAMSRLGPVDRFNGQHYDANTDWFVRWSYRYGRLGNQCVIRSITGSVDVTFTLPKWNPPAGVARSLKTEWSQYLRVLQVHENGHKDSGVEAGKAVLQALRTLPAYSSCDVLSVVANATAEKVIRRYNQHDIEYDRVTQHGYTQGAVFPAVASISLQ